MKNFRKIVENLLCELKYTPDYIETPRTTNDEIEAWNRADIVPELAYDFRAFWWGVPTIKDGKIYIDYSRRFVIRKPEKELPLNVDKIGEPSKIEPRVIIQEVDRKIVHDTDEDEQRHEPRWKNISVGDPVAVDAKLIKQIIQSKKNEPIYNKLLKIGTKKSISNDNTEHVPQYRLGMQRFTKELVDFLNDNGENLGLFNNVESGDKLNAVTTNLLSDPDMYNLVATIYKYWKNGFSIKDLRQYIFKDTEIPTYFNKEVLKKQEELEELTEIKSELLTKITQEKEHLDFISMYPDSKHDENSLLMQKNQLEEKQKELSKLEAEIKEIKDFLQQAPLKQFDIDAKNYNSNRRLPGFDINDIKGELDRLGYINLTDKK